MLPSFPVWTHPHWWTGSSDTGNKGMWGCCFSFPENAMHPPWTRSEIQANACPSLLCLWTPWGLDSLPALRLHSGVSCFYPLPPGLKHIPAPLSQSSSFPQINMPANPVCSYSCAPSKAWQNIWRWKGRLWNSWCYTQRRTFILAKQTFDICLLFNLGATLLMYDFREPQVQRQERTCFS